MSSSILSLGKIGGSGCRKLVELYSREIKDNFSKNFLRALSENIYTNENIKQEEIEKIKGICYVDKIGAGGIFSALWRLHKDNNTGIEIDIRDIIISQHIIEICEFFNKNPYYLESADSYIIITKDTNYTIKELKAKNVNINVIGNTRDDKKAIIWQNGHIRNLDRAKKDELYKDERYKEINNGGENHSTNRS